MPKRLAALELDGDDVPAPVRIGALYGAGICADNYGDRLRARELVERGLALSRAVGDTLGVATALNGLGTMAIDARDYGDARALLEESVAVGRKLPGPCTWYFQLGNLGIVARLQGDYASATLFLEESLARAGVAGDVNGCVYGLLNLGLIARDQGDEGEFLALLGEGLDLCARIGNRSVLPWFWIYLGRLALARGQAERGARLYGAAMVLFDSEGLVMLQNSDEDMEVRACAVEGRAVLGEEQFVMLEVEGRLLTEAEATAEAFVVARSDAARVEDEERL